MRRLRYKDTKEPVQGHTASKCWSWTQPHPGSLGSRLLTLPHQATLPGSLLLRSSPLVQERTSQIAQILWQMCLAPSGLCSGRLPEKTQLPKLKADFEEDEITQISRRTAVCMLSSSLPHLGSCLRFGMAGIDGNT